MTSDRRRIAFVLVAGACSPDIRDEIVFDPSTSSSTDPLPDPTTETGPIDPTTETTEVADTSSSSTTAVAETSSSGGPAEESSSTTDPGPSVCGNGVHEDGESCDDHNDVAGDGCDERCRAESCTTVDAQRRCVWCPANAEPNVEHTGCACLPGYREDGDGCADIDECAKSPCAAGATCANTQGGFTCTCPSGSAGDGLFCQPDECSPNPCGAGATCVNTPGGHACQCPSGSSGSASCTANCATVSLSDAELEAAVREHGLRLRR